MEADAIADDEAFGGARAFINGKLTPLAVTKEDFSGSRTILFRGVPPLLESNNEFVPIIFAFNEQMFRVFHRGFGVTVGFVVISGSELDGDVLGGAVFVEFGTKLGAPVDADVRGVAVLQEPVVENADNCGGVQIPKSGDERFAPCSN